GRRRDRAERDRGGSTIAVGLEDRVARSSREVAQDNRGALGRVTIDEQGATTEGERIGAGERGALSAVDFQRTGIDGDRAGRRVRAGEDLRARTVHGERERTRDRATE